MASGCTVRGEGLCWLQRERRLRSGAMSLNSSGPGWLLLLLVVVLVRLVVDAASLLPHLERTSTEGEPYCVANRLSDGSAAAAARRGNATCHSVRGQLLTGRRYQKTPTLAITWVHIPKGT